MQTGISTACLYPMDTAQSLGQLIDAGYRLFEIFFNSHGEFSDRYIRELSAQLSDCGARVYSFHPYTSGFEPQMFFSDYPLRFDDGRELYLRYADAALRLGAQVAVFHGDRRDSGLSTEQACERFDRLASALKAEGVTLAQENVSRCRSATAAEVGRMTALLGDRIRYVFDVKQALRAGQDPLEMLGAMGGRVVNVHVSDSRPGHDCLLPGDGEADFRPLLDALKGSGAPLITEVYRDAFEDAEQLRRSLAFARAHFAGLPG